MRERAKRLVEGTKGLWIYVVIMKNMLFGADCFEWKRGWLVGWR